MNRLIKSSALALALSSLLLLLTHCGQPYCIAGIGNCSAYGNPNGGVTTGGTLALTPSATAVALGGNVTLTGSGGTPPYTLSITSGGGSGDTTQGSVTQPSTGTVQGTYQAPSNAVPNPPNGYVTIQIQDSAGAKAAITIQVTASRR